MSSHSARLPALPPGDLDDAQRHVYESITTGPRARGPQAFPLTNPDGGLNGPFHVMLHAPRVGAAVQAVGAAIRYETDLSARVREMAILRVAAHHDSAFERWAHEAVGSLAGLREDEMATLRRGEVPHLNDDTERVAITAVHKVLCARSLDDADYRELVDSIGVRSTVDLITLIGYYELLSLQLSVFDIGVPAGEGAADAPQ